MPRAGMGFFYFSKVPTAPHLAPLFPEWSVPPFPYLLALLPMHLNPVPPQRPCFLLLAHSESLRLAHA